MSRFPRHWACFIACFSLGCAPAYRTNRHVRADFTAAVRAQDTARVAALFAPDAFLITPAGDSIRGADVVARYLAQLNPAGASLDLSFGRRSFLEECVGGARERVAYKATWHAADGTGNQASGQAAVFWRIDSTGDLRIAWIALPKKAIGRRLTKVECPSVEDSVLRHWRWRVGLYPLLGFAGGYAQLSFDDVLHERGWLSNPDTGSGRRFHEGSGTSFISLQHHMRPHLVAEVAVGYVPRGTTMGAQKFSNGDSAQTRLWYSAAFVEALVSYERWGVQFGAGPVVQFARWRIRDSFIPAGSSGSPSQTDISWAGAPVGLAVALRFHMLMGRRTYFDVGMQFRSFPRAKTPATPRFPAATIFQDIGFLGTGLGVFF